VHSTHPHRRCPGPRPGTHALPPAASPQLALDALTGQPTTDLAWAHDGSRQFVYRQTAKAEHALAQAFTPDPPADDPVLFARPVTERWLQRLCLALFLPRRAGTAPRRVPLPPLVGLPA
jgi:hypothetical protein